MNINPFKTAIFLICLGLSLNTWATPMPDVSVAVSPQDGLSKEAIRAYQDHEDEFQWYYIPMRFQLEKVGDDLSFRHSFFNYFDPVSNEDLSHSNYQFVFVPYANSVSTASTLKQEIVKKIKNLDAKAGKEMRELDINKIVLSPMPLMDLYYRVGSPEMLKNGKRIFEYTDIYARDPEIKNHLTVTHLYGGVPVDVTVDGLYEPLFSNHLLQPGNAKLLQMGELKPVFKGHYRLYKATATVDFSKLYEFVERKWTDKEESGWWLWKKTKFIERTKIELAKEKHNAGITYTVEVDASLGKKMTVSEILSDGTVIEKDLSQHLHELLAEKITEQAFIVQKVMDEDTEAYRVSEREGTKGIEGHADVNLESHIQVPVMVQGTFMYLNGLTSNLLDPALNAYVKEREERRGR
ncbi:MAG: hypothetical protein A3B70_01760 [Deltaproteobacteria bacterium RIFCSPHIGHO2_02_FULL_40_11]|nr:MAG: hypothetical protein A3B70_01760 [Deltaproteobacteria bacterium RIFCSPHIGHO2_02_FULL_40_11]